MLFYLKRYQERRLSAVALAKEDLNPFRCASSFGWQANLKLKHHNFYKATDVGSYLYTA